MNKNTQEIRVHNLFIYFEQRRVHDFEHTSLALKKSYNRRIIFRLRGDIKTSCIVFRIFKRKNGLICFRNLVLHLEPFVKMRY